MATTKLKYTEPRGDRLSGNRATGGGFRFVPQTQYPNVLKNPSFDADQDWTKGTGWTIAAGVASKAAGTAADLSQDVLVVGRTYHVTFTISGYTAGTLTAKAGTAAGTARNANGTYTETLVCAGTTLFAFAADSSFAGNVDVGCCVIDQSVAVTNVALNGTFGSDSAWIKGTNWTIAAGVAHKATTSATNLTQKGILTANRYYRVEFTISNYVAGTVMAQAGTLTTNTINANGTYSVLLFADTEDFAFVADASFVADIDNVIIRPGTKERQPDAFFTPRILHPVSGVADLTRANGFTQANLRPGDMILVDHASAPSLYVRRGDNRGWGQFLPTAK